MFSANSYFQLLFHQWSICHSLQNVTCGCLVIASKMALHTLSLRINRARRQLGITSSSSASLSLTLSLLTLSSLTLSSLSFPLPRGRSVVDGSRAVRKTRAMFCLERRMLRATELARGLARAGPSESDILIYCEQGLKEFIHPFITQRVKRLKTLKKKVHLKKLFVCGEAGEAGDYSGMQGGGQGFAL